MPASCPKISTCEVEVRREHYEQFCKKHYEKCPFYELRKPGEWQLLEALER